MHGTDLFSWWDTWFDIVHGDDLLQVVEPISLQRMVLIFVTGGGIFGFTGRAWDTC